MPNGHANEPQYAELIADYDRFFAPVAEQVTNFAAAHNLLLEKYYHDAPTLSLRFAHPVRGQATIEVSRGEDDELTVAASWWIDDYDSFTRSIRSQAPAKCDRTQPHLTRQLEDCLKSVLSWTPGQWTQVATGYKGIWDKTMSKAAFEQLATQWPSPK